MRVLVVEDYSPVRKAVAKGLTEAAFAVDVADNGQDGLWYAQHNEYDVIILDLMLPQLDGLSLMRRLRTDGCGAGILLLTARDGVKDRVEGLNSGADDYLTKPFAFEELLARVQVLLRRRYRQSQPNLKIGSLEINTVTKQVCRAGEAIELTRREYSLLHYLAMRHGETISRTEIWQNLYEFNSDAHSNVVDVYIRYLRKKLERPEWPPLIHTRRGFGYCLSEQTQNQ
jgi:DNA-binding response OmpR family regulator